MKDFSESPFLVIWEVTQACRLACIHCRASAQPCRHPLELTTDEGKRLLESVNLFGNPLMVLTGGDPLERPDLADLLRHSVQLGLRTTVTPSATPLLTGEALGQFKEIGVARMAISLDGPDRESHDGRSASASAVSSQPSAVSSQQSAVSSLSACPFVSRILSEPDRARSNHAS